MWMTQSEGSPRDQWKRGKVPGCSLRVRMLCFVFFGSGEGSLLWTRTPMQMPFGLSSLST